MYPTKPSLERDTSGSLDFREWINRNHELVLKRSDRGLVGEFISQQENQDVRQALLSTRETLEAVCSQTRKEVRKKKTWDEVAIEKSVDDVLSPFRMRLMQFLWENEGRIIPHEELQVACSRSKKEPDGTNVLDTSVSKLRPLMRGLGLGMVYGVANKTAKNKSGGYVFLSEENLGIPSGQLSTLLYESKAGHAAAVLAQIAIVRPEDVPTEKVIQSFGDMKKRNRRITANQNLSTQLMRLRASAGNPPEWSIQAERGTLRCLTKDVVPQEWMEIVDDLGLKISMADVMIHLLAHMGKMATPEELSAAWGSTETKPFKRLQEMMGTLTGYCENVGLTIERSVKGAARYAVLQGYTLHHFEMEAYRSAKKTRLAELASQAQADTHDEHEVEVPEEPEPNTAYLEIKARLFTENVEPEELSATFKKMTHADLVEIMEGRKAISDELLIQILRRIGEVAKSKFRQKLKEKELAEQPPPAFGKMWLHEPDVVIPESELSSDVEKRLRAEIDKTSTWKRKKPRSKADDVD